MTNHVHLLATPAKEDGLGQVMKVVGQRYVSYVNRSYGRSGTLWGGRFRSCLVDSEGYLLRCHQYIEMNPVRAGMVDHPAAYRWSSYQSNAEGVVDPALTMHPAVTSLGSSPHERRVAYRELFQHALQPEWLAQMREATNGGHVLGCESFQTRIARALGRPVTRQRRGPKQKPQN